MSKALDLALQWRAARASRLAQEKVVEELKATETNLKKQVIDLLTKSKSKAVSNGQRLFQLKPSDEPHVDDWSKVYAYIRDTGSFDLMERRINRAAVKERWEDKVKIPGVSSIPVVTLSDTAAK
jgi:hypothetical protein